MYITDFVSAHIHTNGLYVFVFDTYFQFQFSWQHKYLAIQYSFSLAALNISIPALLKLLMLLWVPWFVMGGVSSNLMLHTLFEPCKTVWYHLISSGPTKVISYGVLCSLTLLPARSTVWSRNTSSSFSIRTNQILHTQQGKGVGVRGHWWEEL